MGEGFEKIYIFCFVIAIVREKKHTILGLTLRDILKNPILNSSLIDSLMSVRIIYFK